MESRIRRFAATAALSAVTATAACSSEDRVEEPVLSAPARISFTQETKLLASDGKAGDQLGIAAAISGDTIAVSSYAAQSVYVFVRSGGAWKEQQKLAGLGYPLAVALAGDTLLAGAPNSGAFGLVHTFTRAGGAWTPGPTLSHPPGDGDNFGASIAVEGDTVVIGAPVLAAGAAFVYVRSGEAWELQASLHGDSPATDASCGSSVTISGDTILVGCSNSKDPMDAQKPLGAAYAFVRSGATWELQQKLPQMTQTHFGGTVTISGDTAAIGTDSGTHLLTRSGGAWALHSYKSLRYGPAIQGDALVTRNAGNAHFLAREGGAWNEKLILPLATPTSAAAIDGSRVVVTSKVDNDKGASAGAAYVFAVSLEAGDTCGSFAPCPSGFCVDGVCCDTACGGGDPNDCLVCAAALGAPMNGVCGPKPAGQACSDGDLCSKTDACDAAGACLGGDFVKCEEPASACGSAGACNPATGSCSSPDTTECNEEDAPIVAAGSLFDPCQGPADCASGFCSDGVCCDAACDMPCHACNLPSSPGKCVQVPAFTDPRPQCLKTPNCQFTCSEDGACIATTAYAQCAPSRCVGESAPTMGIGASYCPEKQDVCPPSESTFDCSPYICEIALGACRQVCSNGSHCAPGLLCDADGRCVATPPAKVGDAGGCDCQAAGSGASPSAWIWAALAAAGLARGRRRSRDFKAEPPGGLVSGPQNR